MTASAIAILTGTAGTRAGSTPSTPLRRVITTLLACAHTFVCASYPLWLVIGANAGVLPSNPSIAVRALVVVSILTALVLWVLRVVNRDLGTRAIWLSVTLLLFTLYVPVDAIGRQVREADSGGGWFAAAYVCAAIAVSSGVIRPWRARRRSPWLLNVLAALLLAVNVYPVVLAGGTATSGPGRGLVTPPSTASSPAAVAAADRDIYYIVLDGFGRQDVLRDHFDHEIAPFVAFLQSKGFDVPERSQSNYAQTFLSLASFLNMKYLDELTAAVGESSRDRRPLHDLVRQNALMTLARAAGYQVVGIGSDYSATDRFDNADVCFCEQRGLHELEQIALGLTPFGALPLERWTVDAHRQKVIDSFGALERAASMPNRKLVFAHIVAPHPPFVFGPKGERRRATTSFGFFDGDHFRGSRAEYVSGYRDQVQFVTGEVVRLIETVLRRPGPPPAIVLHGDHGPGSMLRWNDAEGTDMRERMGIFAAYYLPGTGEVTLSPALTPVNGMRALASRYLGVDLPPLPDRSFFSTWERPYQLIPVPPASEAP